MINYEQWSWHDQTVLPDLAKSHQSGKKVLPDVAKSRQRDSKGFQGCVGALRLGTYARAPYAFAALGWRLKAGRLVHTYFNYIQPSIPPSNLKLADVRLDRLTDRWLHFDSCCSSFLDRVNPKLSLSSLTSFFRLNWRTDHSLTANMLLIVFLNIQHS